MENHEIQNNTKEDQKKKNENEDRDKEDEIFNIGRGYIEEDDSIWDFNCKKWKERKYVWFRWDWIGFVNLLPVLPIYLVGSP